MPSLAASPRPGSSSSPSTSGRSASSSLTRLLKSVAAASLMLSTGCPRPIVIPDERVPHQLARSAEVSVWCHAPDGSWVECKVTALKGWWMASPQVVDGPPVTVP